jgi:hypothetical protein
VFGEGHVRDDAVVPEVIRGRVVLLRPVFVEHIDVAVGPVCLLFVFQTIHLTFEKGRKKAPLPLAGAGYFRRLVLFCLF